MIHKQFVTMLICMFMLSGCTQEVLRSPDNSSAFPSTDVKSIMPTATPDTSLAGVIRNIPSKLRKDIGNNITIDADISVPDVQEASAFSIDFKTWEADALLGYFFGDMKYKQLNKTFYYSDDGSEMPYYNHTLAINRGWFSYSTLLGFYINNIIQGTGQYDGAVYFPDASVFTKPNLDFMSKDQAVSNVKDQINELGLSIGEPEVYALDYITLQSEEERFIARDQSLGESYKPKVKWSQDDDCYYMVFPIVMDGIPCESIGHSVKQTEFWTPGVCIIAVYSKVGLSLLEIKGSCYNKIGALSQASSFLSFDQIIDRYKDYYKDMVMPYQLSVKEIAFVYTTNATNIDTINRTADYSLIPAWNFIQTYDSSVGQRFQYMLIDAVTGDIISVYG